jgi:hypothetical protein
MITNEQAAEASQPTLDERTLAKLRILQSKLGTQDLETALDKSLNIANYVADTVNDSGSKLLVEHQGKFTELSGIV